MEGKMLQITLEAPGKLKKHTVDIPKPGKNEILVKVERIGLCGSDPTIFRGLHPYVKYPVVMGHEFSGTVAELGEGVSAPAVGTRVTVIPHLICGKCKACKNEIYNFCEQLRCTGAEADGAHCEYKVMPREMVLPIPDEMSLDDAALVEPACVGYHAAKRGEVKQDDIALIIGAGPIGNFCMQSVKALGAKKVIIADMDEYRLGLAAALGADVINVKREKLEDGLMRLAGGPKEVTVFYDCVGGKGEVMNQILRIAARGSRVVIAGVLQNEYHVPSLPDFVQHELRLSGTTMYVPQDYRDMIQLMSRGTISTKGLISHHFKLDELISVFENLVEKRTEPYFKVVFTV
jgi:L-iditol 2-dehydrogenase